MNRFFRHINIIDCYIQFMMECEEGGHLQVLDIDIYRSGKEYLGHSL
jgi:hypothetical protein